MFLLEGEVSEQLQSLREEWDPTMASRVPPHVSVVYPEEATDQTLLMERTRTAVLDTEAFMISLRGVSAGDEGRGGVWFDVHDPSSTWTQLRSRILDPPFRALPIGPHATVVHPRTSPHGREAFATLAETSLDGDIHISELLYTETSEERWRIVERFPLNQPKTQVVAGLLRSDGRMLLCHRTPDRSHYPDVWDLPGGRVEPGENPLQALTRELKEELGIDVRPPVKSAWKTLSNEKFQLHIYLVDDWVGEPINAAPDEHDQIRWSTTDEATHLDLAHSSYTRLLREVGSP